MRFIIQQIVTMPIYGKEALNIRHPYMTDILHYYSTNCHYAHIWQGSPQYLSSYMTDILRYT